MKYRQLITWLCFSIVITMPTLNYAADSPTTDAFDIDGDGEKLALTDGLLSIRYLFGFRDAALVDSALGNGATRTSSTQIKNYLDDSSCQIDIDGNGATEPLTDGLLLIRFLFGFTGNSLINGAIGTGATRSSAAEIEAFIEGGANSCKVQTITHCPRTLPAVSSGTCNITTGTGTSKLIQGNLLYPEGIKNAAEVLIDNGNIMCTGCDCSTEAAAATATVLTCTDAVVSPGLINARISSTFSFNPPFTSTEKFEQRHDWRRGIRGHNQLNLSLSGRNNVQWEEMRAVMAGTTSGVTSGSTVGMLRNLDRSNGSGFTLPATRLDSFPLGDSNGTQLSADCDYPDVTTPLDIQGNTANIFSLAQGIDAVARNEFLCLSGVGEGSEDTLGSTTSIAGGAGLTMRDINSTVAKGTSLVWIPRSETSLYGNTAQLPVFKRANAKIALGTDWSPVGSANITRELNCAAQWNDTWGGDIFTDNELVQMVTKNAADIAGYAAVLGSLEVGKAADITVWNTSNNNGHKAIIDSTNSDVALVMRSGVPLFGESDIVQTLVPNDNCELLTMCGESKRICAQREFGETLVDIQARTPAGAYPLFSCGAWPDERTCTPSRTTPDAYTGIPSVSDSDGDGVANAIDNCPSMFNPPTPLNPGIQADSDNDGIGDLCDPVDNP